MRLASSARLLRLTEAGALLVVSAEQATGRGEHELFWPVDDAKHARLQQLRGVPSDDAGMGVDYTSIV